MKLKIVDLYSNSPQSVAQGTQVQVCGWAKTVRESKNFCFIELNDGSCFKSLQVVSEPQTLCVGKELKLTTGVALCITGKVVHTPDAKQPLELQATHIQMQGECPGEYPLQKKRHSLEYLRTQLHLRPRTNTFSAVFRVRSICAQAVHEFFAKQRFIYVHTPILTASDCEGAGEMFAVTTLDAANPPKTPQGAVDYTQDFFGKEAKLTVSGQLYAECFAQSFTNVYTFGPTFRAENSNTARHAAEFWMIEPEMAFADLSDDMDLAESLIQYVINAVLEKAPDDLAFFDQFVDNTLLARLDNVRNNQFARITYTQAVQTLIECAQTFEYPVSWGCDLQTEHERYLTEKVYGKPVFVTDYPKEIKAFYMRLNDDGKTVAAMDCLVPGVGEIVGGSQREERLGIIKERIEQAGMTCEEYWWYLELRKYGSTKHCGFGMGFDRLVMYITGMSNIRDVLPFPRTTKSAEF